MKIETRTPLLQFQTPSGKLTDSLSAAVFVGDDLFVASDETTSVERLSTDDGLTFQHHKSFPLNDLIDLPAQGTDFDQEIDIEGIDFHDSHLWLVGSHSLKRKKVESNDSGADAKLIKKFGTIKSDGNRCISPAYSKKHANRKERSGHPGVSRLAGDKERRANRCNKARRRRKRVIFIGKIPDIPGKDNGFDIEGLAASGEKVFVGPADQAVDDQT